MQVDFKGNLRAAIGKRVQHWLRIVFDQLHINGTGYIRSSYSAKIPCG